MVRTFNRPPVQVNTPSGNDVKNYFFNHYNWKGLTDNKNVLAVDQETFSDCENIYVDSEGLLRSRPSLKIKTVTYGGQYVLSSITNIWTFGDVTVYESNPNENNYFLTFISKDFPNNTIQRSFTHNNYKLVLYDKKIFVFARDGFYYYSFGNSSTNETPSWGSAASYVHIPVTSIVVNGIPTDVDVEDLNVLTNSYITRYIYDSVSSNDNFSSFVGKTVTVTLDGVDYGITFVENNNLVFVNKYFSLARNNFSDDYIYGDGGAGVPLVDFSDDGSIILSSYSKNQNNDYVWKIYYSTNNVLFEQLPYLNDVLGPAKITKDGNNAIVFLSDGPYIYSLRKYKYIDDTNVVKEFDSWTNLLEYINKIDYESMNISIQYGALVNGSFVSNSDFAFCYTNNDKNDFTLITSLDNYISKKILFSASNVIQKPLDSDIGTSFFIEEENLSIFEDGEYTVHRTGTLERETTYTPESSMPTLRLQFTAEIRYKSGVEDLEVVVRGKVYYGASIVDDFLVKDVFPIRYIFSFYRSTKYFDFYIRGDAYEFTIDVLPRDASSQYITIDDKILVHSNYKPLIDFSINKPTDELSYNCCILFVAKDNTNYYKYLCRTDGIYTLYNKITEVATNNINLLHLIKYNDVLSGHSQQYLVDGSSGIVVKVYSDNTSSLATSSATIQHGNATYYCKMSNSNNYIATNIGLFAYTEYPENGTYTAIPWLMDLKPVHYSDTPYMYNSEFIYSYFNKKIKIDELTSGTQNYIVPSNVCELSNFYFSNGSKLYISQNYIKDGEVEWYFPNVTLQNFNYNIANLHPISNTEVAIFFDDEIWYVTYDSELQAYRYTKSKLQTGCKNGSDVLTTFDGKYTIFASNRGLVAMSYQDYIASTEQSLTYLSDTIYSVFENYITDSESSNQIKLFKFGYWIVIYKQDSNKCFIFDVRNNSWWPISGIDNLVKFVNIDNSVKILSNGNIYELNKLDNDYFDYDGENRTKIDWFIKSQKLHLSALNNYKHISNMTFVSVHDSNILKNTEYDINELDFKLQVNCYRKKVNGNINEPDDFVNVNYKVETIRTFVQRLNYSKINEFQYQLSSDEENAIEIPLSLNSITIKYKIGGQVR